MKPKKPIKKEPDYECWYVESGELRYGPWASAQAASYWANKSLDGCHWMVGKLRSPRAATCTTDPLGDYF